MIRNTAANNEDTGFLLDNNTHDNYITENIANFNGRYGIVDNNTDEVRTAKMNQKTVIITTNNSAKTIMSGSNELQLQQKLKSDHSNKYSGNQCVRDALGRSIPPALCSSIDNNTSIREIR